MYAKIYGIEVKGTPEEISKYAWEIRKKQRAKYSIEAQQAIFDRQESKLREEA